MNRNLWSVLTFPDHKEVCKTAYVEAHKTELQQHGAGYAESGFATKARALQWAMTGGWPNVTANHPN